jgi:uncharacterized protein (TIGR02246 family)
MSEHAKIQSTIDEMTAAFTARDIEGILATYEPDAVVVGQPGVPVGGTPALRELFAQFIAINPEFTFIAHDIVQAGDIALHFNVWKMTGTAPDGTAVEQGGLSVVVLRKQSDGRWLMVIDNPYGDFLLHKQ